MIGILIGFRGICTNLMEIPTGAIADTAGRRRAMIMSHVAYLLSFAFFAVGGTTASFFAAMFIFSVGQAFRSGTHKAIIFDWLNREGRGDEKVRVYGTTRSWSKKGSAVGVAVGAILVFVVRRYEIVFWMSMIPISLNILNFYFYPRYLEGRQPGKDTGLAATVDTLRRGLAQCVRRRSLRSLILESMHFEGLFQVTKDYLQPVVKQVAIGLPLFVGADDRQRTAVLIAGVYIVLHLMSSWASKHSDLFRRLSGDCRRSTRRLWMLDGFAFTLMLAGVFFQVRALMVIAFVVLAVLQNFWRPIMISRIAGEIEESEMATVLSTESQSKTLFAGICAPLLGFAVDAMHPNYRFFPPAALGFTVCLVALIIVALSNRRLGKSDGAGKGSG